MRELAAGGSRITALLLGLRSHGAIVIGTESPELLIDECRQVQRLLEDPDRRTQTGVRASVDALMKQRDLFIARRIDSTLRTNEFGVVFLGMLQSMAEQLPRDVQVVRLLPLGDSNSSRIRRGLLAAGLIDILA